MKRLLSNTSWLIANQIFQMVISFFVGLLSTRYLGPTNYGSITYVGTYISFFSSFCVLGLDTIIISKLVNYKDRDGEIISSAILLRSIAAIISIFILNIIISVADNGDQEIRTIAWLSQFKLLFDAFTSVNYWYQFKLLSKKMVIVDMVAFVVGNAFRIWMLMTNKNVYWFATYTSVLCLLNIVVDVPLFLHDCKDKICVSFSMCKELLRDGIPYMISGIMISLYSQVDIIMIKHMLNGTSYVGYYSAAWSVCNLVAFIPMAISQSAVPVLLQLKKDNSKNYNNRVTQAIAIIVWIGILYSCFITCFSNKIVNLLYGKNFMLSANVLKILVWVTLFQNLTKIRDMWFVGEGQSKLVALYSLLGTLANIVVNYCLIPVLGIYGAALATILTQTIVTLILPICKKETRQYSINVVRALFLKGIDVKQSAVIVLNLMRGKKSNESN